MVGDLEAFNNKVVGSVKIQVAQFRSVFAQQGYWGSSRAGFSNDERHMRVIVIIITGSDQNRIPRLSFVDSRQQSCLTTPLNDEVSLARQGG